ncbi:unnamed protein product [Timema podura]|uniref:Fatty acid desaturase domain-containing protein n=1 Tax=Timema podura TaxID=61482 RepID=A0ABN7NLB7_TIMPD|nr:unnamed protein product [Timema podura]
MFELPMNHVDKRLSLIFHGYLDNVRKTDVIPLILPSLMYFLSGSGLLQTLVTWSWILVTASFFFGLIGINGAHHHPDVFMDGDTPRQQFIKSITSSPPKLFPHVVFDSKDLFFPSFPPCVNVKGNFVIYRCREDADWGLGQLDTLRDRPDIQSNLFLALTQFGHHALHHLFPTVDHSRLEKLYPIMMETCKEFGIEYEEKSIWDMLSGQFQQLARTTPNPHPPGLSINFELLVFNFKQNVDFPPPQHGEDFETTHSSSLYHYQQKTFFGGGTLYQID